MYAETHQRPAITLAELEARFSGGSDTVYRHWLCRNHVYTAGVQFLASIAGAYWLIDEIVLAQVDSGLRQEPFQVWTIATENSSGQLRVDDGNGNELLVKPLSYTDFPMPTCALWLVDRTLLLPCEY
jgi:hypothetical protein